MIESAPRAGDRCPTRGGGRETYAAYLRRVNEQADVLARRDAGAAPFGEHLRLTNEARADRWEPSRVFGLASHSHMKPGTSGNVPDEPRPQASLPRLGDVTSTPEMVRREVIQHAYGVRNLLSRGAVIDLVG